MLSVILGAAGSPHSSYAADQNSTLDSQGNYANSALGIYFQAPAGWTVEEPKKSDASAPDVAVIAPYSSGFTASISITVDQANGTSLADYVKNKEQRLLAGNQSASISFLSEQDSTVGGLPAKTSLLEETFPSHSGNSTIRFEETAVLANDKIYTLTYANDKGNFASDLPNYEQVLSSVKFGNAGSVVFDTLPMGIVAAALAGGGLIVYRSRRRKNNS